jgi:hypothetical protein
MQAAPEVMAQQGAVAAQTRAAEMESARNALAQMQMASAAQEAATGRANREYMQRLIGAGVSGGASVAAMGMLENAGTEPPKKTTAPATTPTASPAVASVESQTPYNEGAVNPKTGEAQYYVPRPAKDAGLVPMTATSREVADMARPSGAMGPGFDIASSNKFTLQTDMPDAGGYRAPSLSLGPKASLTPSLAIGGKQRRSLYGYDPLAIQQQMKLGGG